MKKSIANKVLSQSFRAEVARIIAPHNQNAHGRDGRVARTCARETRSDRENVILLAYAELAQLGYKLKRPSNLAERHIFALAKLWEQKRHSVRTLHKRMSILRIFAGWLGKPGLVGDIERYFTVDTLRHSVATENHAWPAKGIDVDAKLAEADAIDERFGLFLRLQRSFGLRMKESIELKPLRSVTADGAHLELADGTKGGRPRVVPIDTDERRAVIALAREVAMKHRSHRLRWPGNNWTQAQGRFYRLMGKLGCTRKQLGITAHGLRHGYAQDEYRAETGLPTPIEGGALGRIDRETHRYASMRVSWKMGHERTGVVASYYGSYGHALRPSVGAAMRAAAQEKEAGRT